MYSWRLVCTGLLLRTLGAGMILFLEFRSADYDVRDFLLGGSLYVWSVGSKRSKRTKSKLTVGWDLVLVVQISQTGFQGLFLVRRRKMLDFYRMKCEQAKSWRLPSKKILTSHFISRVRKYTNLDRNVRARIILFTRYMIGIALCILNITLSASI